MMAAAGLVTSYTVSELPSSRSTGPKHQQITIRLSDKAA
jgi:hypothetical protein